MMRVQPERSSTKIHVDDNERPVYPCPYCSKEFTDYSSWSLHKQLHTSTQVFRCQLCSYSCRIKKYLARHMKFHQPPIEYKCEVCGKGFHFRCKLDDHMRIHTKEKPFECTVCEKTFSSRYTLSGHLLIHSGEKPFHCSYCEYACRDSSSLRKHEDRHTGAGKAYECKICNKSYKRKWQLKGHLEEKHFGLTAKRHPCRMCDKLFRSKYNVDKHIKAVHERSLACECQICGTLISNKANLAQHMRRHVDVHPYRCTFANCGRRFKAKGDLRKHAIIHYPEKQHPCGICGRLFARRWRLARHMAAHAARRRAVECHHCGVLFYSKNYLMRHISRKHDRKRKKFACDLCDFATSNKPSLVKHLKCRHGGMDDRRDIKCHICAKEYKRQECLNMHYVKAHNTQYETPMKETQATPVEVKEELDEEECIEYHPEIDLLEIHKEELIESECSDPIKYSEAVLTEDISRSIIQRVPGDMQNEFDSFLIDHVMEKPANGVVKLDNCNVDGLRIKSRRDTVEIDVEKIDTIDVEDLRVSREHSEEIDVEKLDEFVHGKESLKVSCVEKSDSSKEDFGEYCMDVSLQDINQENLIKNNVKSVKVFVEKLDESIIEKAVKNKLNKLDKKDVEKVNKGSLKKSVKIAVEKLDINSLKKSGVENVSLPNTRGRGNRNTILGMSNSLKVRLEKLDMSRLKELCKIRAGTKRAGGKHSGRSYAVKSNKNNLARRDGKKIRRKRGVKTVMNSNKTAKKTFDSTPESDITDYSKSVLSEDITRCLQERTGRAPGEPENQLEGIFIDHYMEKTNDGPQWGREERGECGERGEWEWEYSRRVVSEDVSRSIARRDRRAAGEPEAEIDRLFIDHLMEKPDRSLELVKESIDTKKERYVKKCVNNMLQRIRAREEVAILEETRQKYNNRIDELSNKANKTAHINIRYFQNNISKEENDLSNPVDDENDEPNGDGIPPNDNIGTCSRENVEEIDDQIVDNDEIAARDDDDDGEIPIGDEGVEKKNNKIKFNSQQCYICFQLFKTKLDLTRHCKDHFQLCNYKMLKKCPYCGYVTDLQLKKHLKMKHNVTLDMFNTKMTETQDERGPKYVLETEKCNLDVIPSINNLNRRAYIKIDATNRLNKSSQIYTNKLVKKGTEWYVDNEILKITNDYQLPEFTTEEYMSLTIPGDKYEDMMKKLSFLAKKRGVQMLFPCGECDKVCRKMSGLVLHNRMHTNNPRPFRPKRWKARIVKSKKLNKVKKSPQNNMVKVITSVRNSEVFKEFTANRIKRARAKKVVKHGSNYEDNDIETTNGVANDDNISVVGRKLRVNRLADSGRMENGDKCERELMEFYKRHVSGGDIEFGQFLEIFNEMTQENIHGVDELDSSDFGGNTECQTDRKKVKTSQVTSEDGNTRTAMRMPKVYKRVVMMNKRDRQRWDDIKNELRKRIECNNEGS